MNVKGLAKALGWPAGNTDNGFGLMACEKATAWMLRKAKQGMSINAMWRACTQPGWLMWWIRQAAFEAQSHHQRIRDVDYCCTLRATVVSHVGEDGYARLYIEGEENKAMADWMRQAFPAPPPIRGYFKPEDLDRPFVDGQRSHGRRSRPRTALARTAQRG